MKKLLVLLLAALLMSLTGALAEEGAQLSPDEPAEGEYRIVVTDGEGPVQGVAIQFCDESTCSFQMTDESGVAVFRPEQQKAYEVHVLMVPDGYVGHEEVYRTEERWSSLTIVIGKAE